MKNFINSIIVSLAYDDIGKPNLSEYQYAPSWLTDYGIHPGTYLYRMQIDNLLGNEFHTFNKKTTEYFTKSQETFIYPVVLYSNDLFENQSTIDLSNSLLQCIKNKKAKIVFFYLTEGWFGNSTTNYDWLENLTIKYNLEVNDVMIITPNLLAEDTYKGNKFKIITYNYYSDCLFIIPVDKRDDQSSEFCKNNYLNFIDNFKLEKHFLCFNNLTKLHRLWMFYELINNKTLKNKSILSLNKTTTGETFLHTVTPTDNVEMIEYYKTYDSNVKYVYDTNDWVGDVQPGNNINIDAHLKTFVNVVTETLTENRVVYITEKTYKPIYTCQPFIIVGNTYTLKKMKELGYKTFDKWWDESYDDELDFKKRMDKITKLLEKIASWNLDECTEIRNQMRETLIHNYKQMLGKSEIIKFYSSIKTDTKNIEKSKLL
tara:strand:- start:1850 stop:3136 length:1287 start_codon:yes stop_codon:yes gene_type:complete